MTTAISVSARHQYPTVEIVEEGPREGMQIESACISSREKSELINALAGTGLKTIVVGSFVSPRWVPQMADIEDVIAGIEPVPGVTYRALVLNSKGVERRAAFSPPLSLPTGADLHMTRVHLCNVFVRRNTNRGQQDEIDRWPNIIAEAKRQGAEVAGIGLNAAWGSNWQGEFTLGQRLEFLDRQFRLWQDAGIPVTKVWIGDPMGWNTPVAVEEQLAAIVTRYPSITKFHLHLHNTRGLAMISAYAALRALKSQHHLVIDTSVGGIGGCPWCGNGRATGMIPTEDMVQLLEALGIPMNVDIDALVEASHMATKVIGRPLDGHVSRAGPLPSPDRLYPLDLPVIETVDEAQHFWRGPVVYAGARPLVTGNKSELVATQASVS